MTNAQNTPFVREDRYLVIKRKDMRAIAEADDPAARKALDALTLALRAVAPYLPKRECVVVESDWPEHDVVWAAIEERMANGGEPVVPGETRSYEEAFYALASALGFSSARACSPQTALHGLMLPAIEHLKDAEAAHREFWDKTDWVQAPSTPARYLGRHRADIARSMLRDAECERDRLREERDRYRAVLEGAEYNDVDRLGGYPVECCRELGRQVAALTRGLALERGVLPGGSMAAAEPVPLREAIARAVEAQTGASPATAQTKARAAMLLLSIDESTVVLGGA